MELTGAKLWQVLAVRSFRLWLRKICVVGSTPTLNSMISFATFQSPLTGGGATGAGVVVTLTPGGGTVVVVVVVVVIVTFVTLPTIRNTHRL